MPASAPPQTSRGLGPVQTCRDVLECGRALTYESVALSPREPLDAGDVPIRLVRTGGEPSTRVVLMPIGPGDAKHRGLRQ